MIMQSNLSTMLEIHQRPDIPADVAEACERLGWTLIRAQRFAGHTSYLVQDSAGIIEPYPGSTIIEAAAALDTDDPDGDPDAALEAQERQYWRTHRIVYDDRDRPHIATQHAIRNTQRA